MLPITTNLEEGVNDHLEKMYIKLVNKNLKNHVYDAFKSEQQLYLRCSNLHYY